MKNEQNFRRYQDTFLLNLSVSQQNRSKERNYLLWFRIEVDQYEAQLADETFQKLNVP